jgi:hypothetical protein
VIIATPRAAEEGIADDQHNCAVQGETHVREVLHAELESAIGRASLDLCGRLGLRPDQKTADVLSSLAEVA